MLIIGLVISSYGHSGRLIDGPFPSMATFQDASGGRPRHVPSAPTAPKAPKAARRGRGGEATSWSGELSIRHRQSLTILI